MMNETNIYVRGLIWVLVMLLAAPVGALAQTNNENNENQTQGQTYSKAELDQMLAPIALYPDSLLAQVLIAATFPPQVVEADRWVKENKGLSQDQLNAELDKKDWDLSVKALVPFPQVLAMMDDHLDWTTKLGEAFLAGQKDVMASIQELRGKAYAAGNLKTTEQQKVVVEGQNYEIQPADPQTVYVPYYDPAVAYGDWGYPGYPPYAYYPYGEPYLAYGALGFLAGIAVGAFWGWGWGSWNWGGGYANVNVNRNVNINDPHGRFDRGNLRTENFHHFASQHGIGRTAGTAGRPSAASVSRGLSAGRTGNVAGGAAGRTGNVARGGARGTGRTAARAGGSRRTGNVARGGSRGTSSVRGGASRGSADRDIRAGGSRSRGGAAHFGGGGAHFGGGGGHFGGGGGHFGGGGGHGGGGGGHGGGGGGHHR